MKYAKSGFVDNNLVRIRDRLSDTSAGTPVPPDSSFDEGGDSLKTAFPAKKDIDFEKEQRKAIRLRLDEFRMLKRDIGGKITERISMIPEEITISEQKIDVLRKSLEKLATCLDSVQSLDESLWNEHNLSQELGTAIKKLENARLEYIRTTSKMDMLERESEAAGKGGDRFEDVLLSFSMGRLMKTGVFFFFPLILSIIIAASIIALVLFSVFKG